MPRRKQSNALPLPFPPHTPTTHQDLGPVTRIRIGHAGRGARARWHLAHVTARRLGPCGASGGGAQPPAAAAPLGEPPAHFPCGMWFARDEGDGQTARTLTRLAAGRDEHLFGASGVAPVGAAAAATASPRAGPAAAMGAGGAFPAALPVAPQRYRVTVTTSDAKGASTDANVAIVLIGTAGSSGPHALDGGGAAMFERGAADSFEVAAAVGELLAIRIGHDNSGPDPAWRLQDVVVECLGPAAGWDGSGHGGASSSAAALAAAVARPPPLRFVADRWLATGAGDGQTWVTLAPAPPAGSGAAGAEAAAAAGVVELDSGDERAGAGGGSDNCDDDDGYAHLPRAADSLQSFSPVGSRPPTRLAAATSPAATPRGGGGGARRPAARYTVRVHTADARGAGTDANVWIALAGPRGRTDPIMLVGGSNAPQDSVSVFSVCVFALLH